jgi:surface antigen
MRVRLIAVLIAAGLAAVAPALAQGGSPLSSLFSCSNPGAKDRTGAIVGGLAGALIGSRVSKNERALGAIVGAGLGAAAGHYVGCRMNNDGRVRAEGAIRTALDTGRDQTWSDPSSGAYGRIEVMAPGRGDGGYAPPIDVRDLRYARGVDRVYDLRPAAPAYTAPGKVNLRTAPDAQGRVIDQLRPGEEVRVAGQSNGWLAVIEDGRVEGYVATTAMRPAGVYGERAACRTVEQTITQRGYATETNRFNACRDDRGEWRINPV